MILEFRKRKTNKTYLKAQKVIRVKRLLQSKISQYP